MGKKITAQGNALGESCEELGSLKGFAIILANIPLLDDFGRSLSVSRVPRDQFWN